MVARLSSPRFLNLTFEEAPAAHHDRESRQLSRGVCPRCSRPLKLVAIDPKQALLRCSCGAPDHVAPVRSRAYRCFASLLKPAIE